MKAIKAPDGSVVNFPDSTPDTVIINTMAKTYGGSGTNKDYPNPNGGLRVDPAAVRQTLGLPPRAPSPPSVFGDKRAPYGVGGMVAKAVGAKSGTPVAVDMAKSVPTGLAEGTAGLLGLGGDLNTLINKGEDAAGHAVGNWTGLYTPQQWDQAMKGRASADNLGRFPSSADVNGAFQKVAGPYYQPQTTAGKYTRTVASFLPGAALGGEGLLGRTVPAVTGGIASEAAGEATQGTDLEPWARTVGGVAGGGFGALTTQPARVTSEINAALRNATPADLAGAAARIKNANAQGIQLTWPEALDAQTGGRTTATRLLKTVESTKEGQKALASTFAARPQRVTSAINASLDRLAPPVTDPFSLAARAQRAGSDVLSRMSGAVQANAGPIYDRLPGNTLPLSEIDPATGQMVPKYGLLKHNDAYQAALDDLRSNPRKNNAPVVPGQPLTYANLPDNDLAVINKVSTNLGTMADKAAGTPMNPGDRWDASLISDAKDTADRLASAANPDYALARQTYGTGQQAFVEPLKVGPIGALSRSTVGDKALNAQTAALYPSATAILPGSSNTIGTNLALLNEVDPGVSAALTRQHLAGAANETVGRLGPNNLPDQWGGAKFARSVSGSPEQAANLNAGIAASADEPTAQQWSDLLDTLHATGTRQKPSLGSSSFQEDLHDLERPANVVGAAKTAVFDPLKSLEVGRDLFDRWRLGKVSSDIAGTMTGSPDEQIGAMNGAYNRPPDGVGGLGFRAVMPALPAFPFPQPQPQP